jgi:hypothetical protein
MNKVEFTPGPWVPDGEFVIATEYDFPLIDQMIYECSQFGGHLICQELSEPNARLIAAAPEMFDFLQMVVDNPAFANEALREKARELINKITNKNE